jgi:hypothetical protein
MARVINFDTVDACFQHLAKTDEGKQALDDLNGSFESLRSSLPEELNPAEIQYLLGALVAQKTFDDGRETAARRELPKTQELSHGFRILTAVPAV